MKRFFLGLFAVVLSWLGTVAPALAGDLAHGGQKQLGLVESCLSGGVSHDGGDATSDGGGRVGHGTNDGLAGAEVIFELGDGGSSRNAQDDCAVLCSFDDRGQGICHHLRFDGDQQNGRTARQVGVEVNALILQLVRRSRVTHPNRSGWQSPVQPALQHSRSHLAAAQKHKTLGCDTAVFHQDPP